MKSRKKINKALFGPTKEELDEIARNKKTNPVIAIKTNVCEEKNDCPLCSFRPYYGVELVFVLFYADKSIQTVCYKCGKKVAEEIGLKLPMTELEIRYSIEAKFKERQRAARKREAIKPDESKKRWLRNVDTNCYNVQVSVSLWEMV